MLASLVAVPVVSYFTPKYSQTHIDTVFQDTSADAGEAISTKMAG
jgi:hypothetical protein